MGRIFAQQGFPLSYVDQLRLLKEEGIATPEMLTVLAREERQTYPNPAKNLVSPTCRWGVPCVFWLRVFKENRSWGNMVSTRSYNKFCRQNAL